MEEYKKLYGINKFKISGTTWYEELQLPQRFYFVSNIQDYFEKISNKHETTDKSSVQIYVNKVHKRRITFNIKLGYYLELLTLKAMKLLGST